MIRGGVGPNVVPDSCRASLDMRLPPGVRSETMLAGIHAAIARAQAARPGLEARIHGAGSRVAVACAPSERIVRLALELCEEQLGIRQQAQPTPGYATDASVLCSDPPVPFVIIGPGRETSPTSPTSTSRSRTTSRRSPSTAPWPSVSRRVSRRRARGGGPPPYDRGPRHYWAARGNGSARRSDRR